MTTAVRKKRHERRDELYFDKFYFYVRRMLKTTLVIEADSGSNMDSYTVQSISYSYLLSAVMPKL